MESESKSVCIDDLPLEDIFPDLMGKHLQPRDLFNLRCCSRRFKALSDEVLAKKGGILMGFGKIVAKRGSLEVIARTCRELKHLKLINVPCVTDDMLIEMINNNPNLESFEYCGDQNVTSTGLLPLVHCKKLTRLKLYRESCHLDVFLQELNQHNNNLVHILLSDRNFSAECLEEFFEKQPNLRSITLYAMIELNPSFYMIARNCKNLRFLNIRVDCAVRDRFVLAVAMNCPHIKTILLHKYSHLSKRTLDFLKSKNIDIGEEPITFEEFEKFVKSVVYKYLPLSVAGVALCVLAWRVWLKKP